MNKLRILIVVIALIYGVYFCYFKKETHINWPEESVTIVGIIDDYPESRISTNRYRVKIESLNGILVNDDSKILLVTHPYTRYQYGNKIQLTGNILKPEDFITDTGKTFDYENYLKLSKVYGITRDPEIEIVDDFSGNRIKRFLFKCRNKFSLILYKYLKNENSNLSKGVLLGERSSITNEFRNNMSKSSTSHIIALSGYNITIVSEIIMKMLSFFSILVRSLLGIFGIFIFIIMAGGGSSAIRAGIMAGILIYSRSRGRNYNALWALFLAGSILILINPLILRYDMGFHLSLLATYGLIVFQKYFSVGFVKIKLHRKIAEILSSTVSASLLTMPYIAYNIGIISILGIVANIIVVPLIPVLMLFSFLVGIMGSVSIFLGKILGFATNFISDIIILTINTIGSIKFAAVSVNNISLLLIIIIYLLIFYKGFLLLKKSA